MMVLLSVLNIFGVKTGALVQNVFTLAKVAAFWHWWWRASPSAATPQAVAANFGDFWRNAGWAPSTSSKWAPDGPWCWWGPRHLAVAQVGSLFSADAWNNVTFTAGEVESPAQSAAARCSGHRHR